MYSSVSKEAIITISKIAAVIFFLFIVASFYDRSKTAELNEIKREKGVLMDSLVNREKTIYKLKKKYETITNALRDDVVIKVPDSPKRDTYIREQLAPRRNSKR